MGCAAVPSARVYRTRACDAGWRLAVLTPQLRDRSLGIRRESNSTPWLTDLIWAAASRLRYDAHFLPDALPVD